MRRDYTSAFFAAELTKFDPPVELLLSIYLMDRSDYEQICI
jgi:hypothetical protein